MIAILKPEEIGPSIERLVAAWKAHDAAKRSATAPAMVAERKQQELVMEREITALVTTLLIGVVGALAVVGDLRRPPP